MAAPAAAAAAWLRLLRCCCCCCLGFCWWCCCCCCWPADQAAAAAARAALWRHPTGREPAAPSCACTARGLPRGGGGGGQGGHGRQVGRQPAMSSLGASAPCRWRHGWLWAYTCSQPRTASCTCSHACAQMPSAHSMPVLQGPCPHRPTLTPEADCGVCKEAAVVVDLIRQLTCDGGRLDSLCTCSLASCKGSAALSTPSPPSARLPVTK